MACLGEVDGDRGQLGEYQTIGVEHPFFLLVRDRQVTDADHAQQIVLDEVDKEFCHI